MATVYHRLAQLPPDYQRLRENAPRADGLDQLPAAYTVLGFGPYSLQGDVVSVDDSVLRTGSILAPIGTPPGVERVFKVSVLQPYSGKLGSEIFGATAGEVRFVTARCYDFLKGISVIGDAP